MSQSDLNPCNEPSPFEQDLRIDPIPPFCPQERHEESLRDVAGPDLSWLVDQLSNTKTGFGESALCDPMQKGYIMPQQGMNPPDFNVIYRYQDSLRGTDEAMTEMFSDIIVTDEQGKHHPVPIMWGSQERAVATVLQENVRKDESAVVDRPKLPLLAIYSTSFEFDWSRYVYHKAVDYRRFAQNDWKPGFTASEGFIGGSTVFGMTRGIPINVGYTLYAWSMSEADLKQITTQVITKFSRMAYIRVKGVGSEIGVEPGEIRNNVSLEPGDKVQRVLKFEYTMTAQTYVMQPLQRKQAVLKTQIDIVDGVDQESVREIITRLEDAIEELQ